MLRLGTIVIGAADLDRAERFWTAALTYRRQPDQGGDEFRVLVPANGEGSEIAMQSSDESASDHPRLHVDLLTDSLAEQAIEVDRLLGLGAVRVDWDRYPEDPDFVVLADPEGNRFCVVDLGHQAAEP